MWELELSRKQFNMESISIGKSVIGSMRIQRFKTDPDTNNDNELLLLSEQLITCGY